MPDHTPRKFTLAIKNCLAAHGIPAEVKSKTESFAGFGYGKACTASVRLGEALPEAAKQALSAIETAFRESGEGPRFSEKQASAYKISLGGTAYPFGGRVTC